MHLKLIFFSFYFSLTFYIFVFIYNFFGILALHANTVYFASYISVIRKPRPN